MTKNNPVPVDTPHWLSVNDNCTITYNGVTSKIDVEKENIPYKERPYWECADGSTITPGSVVIADNLNGEDHSWIYIGEFNNRDEVIAYLKKIGVNESYINSNTVGDGSGDGGTHWRIESNGSQGCVINNKLFKYNRRCKMKPLKSERLPMLEDIMYTEPKDWQKKIRTTIQHVRQAHSKAMKQKKYLNNNAL